METNCFFGPKAVTKFETKAKEGSNRNAENLWTKLSHGDQHGEKQTNRASKVVQIFFTAL